MKHDTGDTPDDQTDPENWWILNHRVSLPKGDLQGDPLFHAQVFKLQSKKNKKQRPPASLTRNQSEPVSLNHSSFDHPPCGAVPRVVDESKDGLVDGLPSLRDCLADLGESGPSNEAKPREVE